MRNDFPTVTIKYPLLVIFEHLVVNKSLVGKQFFLKNIIQAGSVPILEIKIISY